MATYGSLLLCAGGGILDHDRQAPQNGEANVVIGLGGTGSDAVMLLKEEVYRQLRPDDVNSAVPAYNNIRFLLIDSDKNKFGCHSKRVSDINLDTEFISLANCSICATFGASEAIRHRRQLDWLDYEHISTYDVPPFFDPCRQIGRFLLVDQSEKVHARLKAVIESALEGSGKRLTVHICSGLCGMTGSGIFLDVCYLVRHILEEIGRPDADICGYFFLPEVNLAVPALGANPLSRIYTQVNSYAALMELDYCMNFPRNRDSFKMDYGFLQIDIPQPPVDQCYLLSSMDQQGAILSNGYGHAMETFSHFLISSMMKKAPSAASPECAGRNIVPEPEIQLRYVHGASRPYSILGAAVAEIPFTETIAYLGFLLLESYGDMFDRVPTEKEGAEFLQGAGLTYDNILKDLSGACNWKIPFPQTTDARQFMEQGDQPFIYFAEEYLAMNLTALGMNSRLFMASPEDFAIPEDSVSLIGRTYKALWENYVTNPEYGPLYAQRMLYGSMNTNLVHAVDGLIAYTQTNLEAEHRQSQRRSEEYDEALAEMQDASLRKGGFLVRNRKFAYYLYALDNLYAHHYRIAQLETMDAVLQEYKQQLIRLNDQWFRNLTAFLETLRNTFRENARCLDAEDRAQRKIVQQLFSVHDIRSELEEIVQDLNLREVLTEMMTMLTGHPKAWRDEDDAKIMDVVSRFLLKIFRDRAQTTIADYLKGHFPPEKAEELIRSRLLKQAEPLFWTDPICLRDFDSADLVSLPMAYRNACPPGHRFDTKETSLLVPEDFRQIAEAAGSFDSDNPFCTLWRSAPTDRIYMTRVQHGLPLYAYKNICELQNLYERDNQPGRHLYERGKVNWNEWLPSPIPRSFLSRRATLPPSRIEAREKALLAEFETAEENGVVVQSGHGCWAIMLTEDFDIDAYILSEGFGPEGQWNAGQYRSIADCLRTKYQDLLADAKPVPIHSEHAYPGCERNVMLDFYLMSPALNQLLHEELDKLSRISDRAKDYMDVCSLYEEYRNLLDKIHQEEALNHQLFQENNIRKLEHAEFVLNWGVEPDYGIDGLYTRECYMEALADSFPRLLERLAQANRKLQNAWEGCKEKNRLFTDFLDSFS